MAPLRSQLIVIISTLLVHGARCNSFPIQLVEDVFSQLNIRVLSVITCSIHDSFWPMKRLMSRGFWIQLNEMQMRKSYQLGIFMDYDCASSENILLESSVGLLNSRYKWLVWSEANSTGDETVEYKYDSEVTWARPGSKSGEVVLHDVYKTSTPTAVFRGVWDPHHGLRGSSSEALRRQKRNLRELVIKASVVFADSEIPKDQLLQSLDDPVDKCKDYMAGYHYALYTHLRDWFNFRLDLHATNSYGYPKGNGIFDGLVGQLQSGEVDVGISSVRFTTLRNNAVDFTVPTWLFRNPFLFKQPKATGSPTALVRPFSLVIWLSLMGSWLLLTTALRFFHRAEKRILSENTPLNRVTVSITIISMICAQGCRVTPRLISVRIILLIGLVKSLFLWNYYSASLVSFLMDPSAHTIHTVKDLLDSKLEVGYVNISYNRDFFKRNTDPDIADLYHKKIFAKSRSFPNEFSKDEALLKIKDGSFAIQAEAIILYPLIAETFEEEDICLLKEVVAFPSSMLYSVVQKNSPYRELFTYGFRILWERGLIHRQLQIWRPVRPRCSGVIDLSSVELEAVSLAYVILAAGVLISIAFLLFECIGLRRKQRREQEVQV